MDESLTTQRRVEDEDLRVVNSCRVGRKPPGLIAREADGTIKGSPG
jgi:hypothetical protein